MVARRLEGMKRRQPYTMLNNILGLMHVVQAFSMYYRVYANKTQDLINARKFVLWDFS